MLNFTSEIVKSVADTGLIEAAEAEALLVTPPKEDMGDYALPCFTLAKRLRKNPAAIAAEIAEKIAPSELIVRVETQGAYLNFFVNRTAFVRQCFSEISDDSKDFGATDHGRGKTVVIDYSSPNIAKEFRVFHLRTTVLGHALYNIFRALGYKVVSVNHLGDWGTQFGVVIAAFKEKGDREALDHEPLKYLTQLYVDYNRRMAEDESLRETARGWLRKLEDGDEEAHELWRLFCDLSIKDFKRVYLRLGIEFDHYLGESFYFRFTDEIIRKAQADGVAVESQGAIVIKMDDEDIPPVILRKSDGATGYHTRDIAAAIWRHENFGFDKMLYVVGAEQKLYFRQLIEALEKLGHGWAKNLEHVAHGLYLDTREVDGVQVRAKAGTRSGFKVILEDIIDDAVARAERVIDENYPNGFPGDKKQAAEAIGIGAIVFGDLKNGRIKDVVFDWETVLNFKGESGPYLQYSHARLCSILGKYGGAVEREVDFALLDDPEEFAIARLAADLPRILLRTAEACEPSVLCSYLVALAGAFNKYYTDISRHKVVDPANPARTKARVLMVDCVRRVLGKGLKILGISPMEKM